MFCLGLLSAPEKVAPGVGRGRGAPRRGGEAVEGLGAEGKEEEEEGEGTEKGTRHTGFRGGGMAARAKGFGRRRDEAACVQTRTGGRAEEVDGRGLCRALLGDCF